MLSFLLYSLSLFSCLLLVYAKLHLQKKQSNDPISFDKVASMIEADCNVVIGRNVVSSACNKLQAAEANSEDEPAFVTDKRGINLGFPVEAEKALFYQVVTMRSHYLPVFKEQVMSLAFGMIEGTEWEAHWPEEKLSEYWF